GTPGRDAAVDSHIKLLRSYLQGRFQEQSLHNRAWALWAAARLPEALTQEQRKPVIAQLREKQQADGGWRLASLATHRRGDGAAQDADSDGYATGLVIAVLRAAHVPKDDPQVAKGLAWLRANQEASGAWRGSSVNRRRPRDTHVGR